MIAVVFSRVEHMKIFWKIAICGALSSLGIAGAAATATATTATATPPRVDMTQPRPQDYPDSAQSNGEEGTVVVDVYERQSGRPAKIRIKQSSGFSDLDNAAVESVLNWRFMPATRDGDTVSDWTKVKVVYQLPRLPARAPLRPPG
jgi:protein TonB